MQTGKREKKFRDLLDNEYEWPADYTFKFIVPSDKQTAIASLFPKHQLQFRSSSGGKYLSLTVTVNVESADLVIAIYEQAAQIDGLIAL